MSTQDPKEERPDDTLPTESDQPDSLDNEFPESANQESETSEVENLSQDVTEEGPVQEREVPHEPNDLEEHTSEESSSDINQPLPEEVADFTAESDDHDPANLAEHDEWHVVEHDQASSEIDTETEPAAVEHAEAFAFTHDDAHAPHDPEHPVELAHHEEETEAATAATPRRMGFNPAYFFIPLNIVILIFGVWYLTGGFAGPTEEPAKETPSNRSLPDGSIGDADTSPLEPQGVKQARLKLAAAKHWADKDPDRARELAKQAIELAPEDSDIAQKARDFLSGL